MIYEIITQETCIERYLIEADSKEEAKELFEKGNSEYDECLECTHDAILEINVVINE